MIKIETYTSPYQQQVIDLILPIQQHEFNVPVTIADQPDLLQIPQFYQKDGGNFWLALDGNRVVGTIALIDFGGGQGALRKMFVQREYRGREKGIAQQLLDTLTGWAKNHRISEIYLGTVEQLKAAQQFYLKNNFVPFRKEDLPVNFPLMAVDTHFFKLSL